jgi:hypothetical protein
VIKDIFTEEAEHSIFIGEYPYYSINGGIYMILTNHVAVYSWEYMSVHNTHLSKSASPSEMPGGMGRASQVLLITLLSSI